MADQDNIIALNQESEVPAPETTEEVDRAAGKTAAKKTAARKTSSAAAKKPASSAAKKPASTAAKKPASSTAKKPASTAAKKTSSSAQPRLSAREKQLIANYRKCGEAGKLMLDTMAEKTAGMAGKDSGSESGLGSALSSLASGIDLSSLSSLFGK